jgi:hypothetical protein
VNVAASHSEPDSTDSDDEDSYPSLPDLRGTASPKGFRTPQYAHHVAPSHLNAKLKLHGLVRGALVRRLLHSDRVAPLVQMIRVTRLHALSVLSLAGS